VNRQRHGAWWALLAVCLSLVLCGALYRKTRSLDLETHAELKEALKHVEQLDSDLGKGVLGSRYGLVNQYDALTQGNADLDASRRELRSLLSVGIGQDATSEHAIARLEQALVKLRGDVESFKTQNSVLKNSLFYLPVAGETLSAGLMREKSAHAADTREQVQALVRSTLVYNLLRTGTLRDSLSLQHARLEAAGGTVSDPLRPRFDQFLKHARTVTVQQDLVDPLVARISAGELSRAAADVEVLCDSHLEREAARANGYRSALLLLVASLLGALFVIGFKLRRLYATLEQQVLERTRTLAEEKLALQVAERGARLNEARINAIIEGAREGIVRLGTDGKVRSWNPAAALMFGAADSEIQCQSFVTCAVLPEAQPAFLAWLSRVGTDGFIDQADYWHESPLVSATNRTFAAECSVARRDPGIDDEITLFVRDVSLARGLEAELRQAQKLESVGRLASGIAHEINTPIQFVSDSCFFVHESFKALFGLVRGYADLLEEAARGGDQAGLRRAAAALEEEADLGYLITSVPKSIETMGDGLTRVAELVAGMKTFAHPDQKEKVMVDLNHALTSTLVIARNEYKYVADLQTDLADLPQVLCHAGEINQVILNILVNAAHAIGDRVRGTDRRGQIAIRSRVEGDAVLISISDSGGGIPPEIQPRIFDPFFTTKEVGKGTGQGLAIARSVVVDKHGGELSFVSERGKGTTFHIRLPIRAGGSSGLSAA